jgi:hypothetical protein
VDGLSLVHRAARESGLVDNASYPPNDSEPATCYWIGCDETYCIYLRLSRSRLSQTNRRARLSLTQVHINPSRTPTGWTAWHPRHMAQSAQGPDLSVEAVITADSSHDQISHTVRGASNSQC